MYAAIRQFKARPGSAEALTAKINEALPTVREFPGFVGYYAVYAPDDTVTAVGLFNTVAEAHESNWRALAFIEEDIAPLVVGRPTVTAGPVIAQALP